MRVSGPLREPVLLEVQYAGGSFETHPVTLEARDRGGVFRAVLRRGGRCARAELVGADGYRFAVLLTGDAADVKPGAVVEIPAWPYPS